MPIDTKPVKRSSDGIPVSQGFNSTIDDFEVLAAEDGALFNKIKDSAGNKIDPATEDSLASILAKIIAAPATEAKQDTLLAKDFATQTTLAAVLAKLADPATQTTLAALLTQADIKSSVLRDAILGTGAKTLTDLATLMAAIQSTDGIKKIADAVDVADRAARELGAVTISGSLTSLHTFQDATVAAADGTAFTVAGYKTLTVYISGTSTSRTIQFKALPPGAAAGDYRSLMGVRLSDFATGVQTTGNNEVWQFDVTGLTEVLMDCSAVAGGNITVKGRAVA